VLGSRWERYGSTPDGIIEAGNVLEPGAAAPGYGWACLEEDVRVTDTGIEWLSMAQTELWIVPASG
jgi:Xaa-Pro aminopeptidase